VTVYFPFTPSAFANFSFQPTFDGATYNGVVTWSYYGQRYYLTISTVQGANVYTLPLIASPDNYDLNLNWGYFTTPLVFRESTQNLEVG
jgi:hypothetical protein